MLRRSLAKRQVTGFDLGVTAACESDGMECISSIAVHCIAGMDGSETLDNARWDISLELRIFSVCFRELGKYRNLFDHAFRLFRFHFDLDYGLLEDSRDNLRNSIRVIRIF